ncbi:MAG: flavodoxin family protein [Candidatus Omnitrophota bacterium]
MNSLGGKIYVLGLSASPRPGSNSDILLDKALEGAGSCRGGARTEKVSLCRIEFSPCRECADMPGDGRCTVKDGLQGVYDKINRAGIIILSSPIFFGSLSAQAKMMVDRMQCLWRAQYILHRDVWKGKRKIGGLICVQASQRQDFFQNARSIARNFFAAVNTEYKGGIFCPGLEEKGAVLRHSDFLRKAKELGERLCLRPTT